MIIGWERKGECLFGRGRDQKSSGELEEVEREVMGAKGGVYLIVVMIRNEARVMVDHILV